MLNVRVRERSGAPREQPRGLGLDGHLGEQLLHELEASDRATEGAALARVADRRVEAALRDAHAPRRERDPADVERRHRDTEAAVELAQAVLIGDAHRVQRELRRVLCAEAELALDRARVEAVRVGRDKEAGDAAGPRRAGAREDERNRRPGAERDERLRARQRPAVAVALRPRRERRGVGAAARLGQRVAPERLARREPGQPLALLLLGAEARDRLADEPHVDRDDSAHGRIRLPELLDDERVRQGVEGGAAVLLAPARAEVACGGQLVDERAVEHLRAVPVAHVRRDLALSELARGGADELLFRGEPEIHPAVISTQRCPI